MTEIESGIKWWLEKGCQSNDINFLLIAYGRLAGYSYYFADKIAEYHGMYITQEHERKKERDEVQFNEISEGSTLGKSELKASLKTADARMKEKYYEIQYRDSKLKLEQVNQVLSSMQMRISYLKKEQERTQGDT